MGHYEKALRYLNEAYKLEPTSHIAAYLGEVLWITGQQESATALWQAALQQAPSNQQLQRLLTQYDTAKQPIP